MKRRVLFVCTHNSAWSQMAEGMLRAWAGDRFEAFSAGTEPTEVPAHWGIEDPSAANGFEEERLAVFRRVRNDISNRLHMFILAAGRSDVPTRAGMRLPR